MMDRCDNCGREGDLDDLAEVWPPDVDHPEWWCLLCVTFWPHKTVRRERFHLVH